MIVLSNHGQFELNKLDKPRRAVIFANGPVSDYASLSAQLCEDDVNICVDGGLRHIDALALTPTIVIGDMDSVSMQRLSELRATTPNIEHPREKDQTDLELALQWVADKKFTSVLLTGISGGRLDHTLANIHLMSAKRWPFELCAWQPGQYLWLMDSEKTLKLNDYVDATISLLPMSENVSGIKTEGMKYILNGEALAFGSTRGISNVIESQQASISFVKGRLLVVLTYQEAGFP